MSKHNSTCVALQTYTTSPFDPNAPNSPIYQYTTGNTIGNTIGNTNGNTNGYYYVNGIGNRTMSTTTSATYSFDATCVVTYLGKEFRILKTGKFLFGITGELGNLSISFKLPDIEIKHPIFRVELLPNCYIETRPSLDTRHILTVLKYLERKKYVYLCFNPYLHKDSYSDCLFYPGSLFDCQYKQLTSLINPVITKQNKKQK